MSTENQDFLRALEAQVKTEIADAGSSDHDALVASPAEWLFDPIDVERERVGLTSLLGAVEAVEKDPATGHTPLRPPGIQ